MRQKNGKKENYNYKINYKKYFSKTKKKTVFSLNRKTRLFIFEFRALRFKKTEKKFGFLFFFFLSFFFLKII